MKKYLLVTSVVLAALTIISCGKSGNKPEATAEAMPNTLTEEEKQAGWELLFDGQTLNGWKRYGADTIGPLWIVKDGQIVCNGEGLSEGTKGIGGSLTTLKQFGNFELTVDWKITAGGNSGILYHVVEKPEYEHEFETGPEFQIMDDAGWKGSLNPAQKVGSNYDMYEAPANKKVNPVGEWNTARIVYDNGHVEHWLNGEKTVEFMEGDEDYQKRYEASKWVDYPGWNVSKVGAISLQDHGANVYFRNIKIRPI